MRNLLLILLLLTGMNVDAQTVKLDKTRTIEVLGAVDITIIEKAKQLDKLAKENKKDIYILINSPGGSVAAGNIFISAMTMAKARGVKVKCVVPVYAASMAFSIMLNCSENYALPNASLLFHPVRIGLMGYLTALDAFSIYKDLIKIDIQLLSQLYSAFKAETNAKKEEINEYYLEERWWNTVELLEFIDNKSFITIVDNIEGTDKTFELDSPNNKQRREVENFEIIYIAPSLPNEGVN